MVGIAGQGLGLTVPFACMFILMNRRSGGKYNMISKQLSLATVLGLAGFQMCNGQQKQFMNKMSDKYFDELTDEELVKYD